MNDIDLETRLSRAASVAAPPRSVVEDVMRQIPLGAPAKMRRPFWRRPVFAASVGAFAAAAAVIVFVVFVAGPSSQLALADVQAAFEKQSWVHVKYDAGQIADDWVNLNTGEWYASRYDGDKLLINQQTGAMLWYSKYQGVIEKTPGKTPSSWRKENAWDEFVGGFARAATQPSAHNDVRSVRDTLNGLAAVRFDQYIYDALGQRILYVQLWADAGTHLPLRIKTHLQLGERKESGKEWSTGDFDFPSSGPADLYALGVPRGTPMHQKMTAPPDDVRHVVEAIEQNHDNFLKNYRAVMWGQSEQGKVQGMVDVIWRDGQRLRENKYGTLQSRSDRRPALPAKPTTDAIIAWALQRTPSSQQLMDEKHEYSWQAPPRKGPTTRPQVQVMGRHAQPLLANQSWPETLQWPMYHLVPEYQLLPKGAETPAGTIGLRWDAGGKDRRDYYVDPHNDYVCFKEIDWVKNGGNWIKDSEETLVDLHRVNGRVVAGRRITKDFGELNQRYLSVETLTIDLKAATSADYPPGIFDPGSITKGADVIGY